MSEYDRAAIRRVLQEGYEDASQTVLTDFLLARIAEDEAVARAVVDLGHVVDMGGNRLGERWYVARLTFSSADGAARSEQDVPATELFARHDPARVLAECEAKRRIVERASAECLCTKHESERVNGCAECAACDAVTMVDGYTVSDLASVYADHPDYDEAWSL